MLPLDIIMAVEGKRVSIHHPSIHPSIHPQTHTHAHTHTHTHTSTKPSDKQSVRGVVSGSDIRYPASLSDHCLILESMHVLVIISIFYALRYGCYGCVIPSSCMRYTIIMRVFSTRVCVNAECLFFQCVYVYSFSV
jgi:hypothetical protein